MNPFVLFASSNETDRRALIIGIVILLVLFLIIGLIGGALRFLFLRQSDRAEGMINNVVRAHVVNTPKELKRFGFRKNARALFRDTLWPFLIAFVGMLVWIIENIAVARWGDNIFADFADLFFWFDWGAEGVVVKFFGLPIIAAFPPVSHNPEFHLEPLCHYIECFLFIVAIVWYAVACQGFIARMVRIDNLAHSIFDSSLKDFKAQEDIHVTPEKPLPPSE